MLCGEGGNESGCACSGFGGVGGSAGGGREKKYHKTMNTTTTTNNTNTTAQHKYKSITPNHTVTGTTAATITTPHFI